MPHETLVFIPLHPGKINTIFTVLRMFCLVKIVFASDITAVKIKDNSHKIKGKKKDAQLMKHNLQLLI